MKKIKALLTLSLSCLLGGSILSLASCSPFSQTELKAVKLTITNKEELTSKWNVGDTTRTIKLTITTTEDGTSVNIESAIKDGSLTVTSSDTSVVSAEGLTLTALKEGTSTITVKYNDLVDIVLITVTDENIQASKIEITNKEELTSKWSVGETARTLSITISSSEEGKTIDVTTALENKTLTVTSSDTSVVSTEGLTLTPLKEGKTTITVAYQTLTDSVELIVNPEDQEIDDKLKDLSSFVSTFREALSTNQPSSYGVIRTQTTTSTGKSTTTQHVVKRTSKEVLLTKQQNDTTTQEYYGVLGNNFYQINIASYSWGDVTPIGEDEEETYLTNVETKYTSQLNGGTNLASGDISIYFKYDSTNSLHGLKGDYTVTSNEDNYTIKAGFYIDPANTSYGSGAVYEYTYTLNADYLPTKVEVSRVYVNASNWDFDKHEIKEGGTSSFSHIATFTKFDYTQIPTTNEESPLIDVNQYFVSSIDSSKFYLTKSENYSQVRAEEIYVGDTVSLRYDEDSNAFSPSTALDSDEIMITASSDENVFKVTKNTWGISYTVVGAGSATLTIGTSLHPSLGTIEINVKANPNIGTEDNPVEAYFASWGDTTPSNWDGDFDNTTYEYKVTQINFTATNEPTQVLARTNQTGVVKFDDINSKLGIDTSICTAEITDYSEYPQSGYLVITFTPKTAGTTSLTLYTSATEYTTIPVVITAA